MTRLALFGVVYGLDWITAVSPAGPFSADIARGPIGSPGRAQHGHQMSPGENTRAQTACPLFI
jgi:hypothetical protein